MTANEGAGIGLRTATGADGEALCRIYEPYVTSSIVTFEEEPVGAAEMSRRVRVVADASLPWLVAEANGDLLGYAYASAWRGRSAYRFTVETAIYVSLDRQRQGVGLLLYGQLIALLRESGVRAAIGGISLPNDGSVALHERLGFRKVAHFHEVGFKLGRWIDVGFWQLLFPGPPSSTA